MEILKTTTVSGKAVYIGKAFNKDLTLVICGIGKVNAAIGTQIAIDLFGAKKILNFGVAGGLNDNTELCQVYQIEKAVQFDFDLTQLNGTKMGTLDEYNENYLPLSTLNTPYPLMKLGTADRFNDAEADYLLLTNELKADIRDMEGCAIVQTAIKANIPVCAFKSISDVAKSGNTTEQYVKNRENALKNLKNQLSSLIARLSVYTPITQSLKLFTRVKRPFAHLT
jgi:adenosylhomocysteine nucleosidase